MDKRDSKEAVFSFPEFQYSNPKDKCPMPDQFANQPKADKDEAAPQTPIVCPKFPIRYRTLTQLGSIASLVIVSLRALLMLGWLLDLDVIPWMGPLQHVVVFDKIIIGAFLGVWYMWFLVQIWEADLFVAKKEAAARGDAHARADIEALREKRDWDMLLRHRPYDLSWIFASRKGTKKL